MSGPSVWLRTLSPPVLVGAIVLLNTGAIALAVDRFGSGPQGPLSLERGLVAVLLLLCLLIGVLLARAWLREPPPDAVSSSARTPGAMALHAPAEASVLFLVRLARELRAPIVPVLDWLRLLRSRGLGTGEAATAIDAIERGVRDELRLLDACLLAPATATPTACAALPGPLGRLDGVRVLVVDDEPVAHESLRALLGSCGAEARVAGSAEAARAVLQNWCPDVIVCDIGMPGEDGCEFLETLRRTDARRIPAVALTAAPDLEAQLRSLAAGFQAYLTKPADPHELFSIVRTLCRPRAERGEGEGR